MTTKMEKRLLSKLGKNIEYISNRKSGNEILVTLRDKTTNITVERSLRHLLRRDKIDFFVNVETNKNNKNEKQEEINKNVPLSDLINSNKEKSKKTESSFISREELSKLEETIMNKLESMSKKLDNITIRVRLDN